MRRHPLGGWTLRALLPLLVVAIVLVTTFEVAFAERVFARASDDLVFASDLAGGLWIVRPTGNAVP